MYQTCQGFQFVVPISYKVIFNHLSDKKCNIENINRSIRDDAATPMGALIYILYEILVFVVKVVVVVCMQNDEIG